MLTVFFADSDRKAAHAARRVLVLGLYTPEISGQRRDLLSREFPGDGLHHRIGAPLRTVFVHDLDEALFRPADDRRNTLMPPAELVACHAFGGKIFAERTIPCSASAAGEYYQAEQRCQ